MLWRKVGASCATAADEQMRNLDCQRIQCDEIWTFCRMKQAYIPRFTDRTKVGACLRRRARELSVDCRTFVVGGGRHVTGVRTHVRVRVYQHYRRHY